MYSFIAEEVELTFSHSHLEKGKINELQQEFI